MLKFTNGVYSPTYYQLINRCPRFRHCPCSPESLLWPRALFPGSLPLLPDFSLGGPFGGKSGLGTHCKDHEVFEYFGQGDSMHAWRTLGVSDGVPGKQKIGMRVHHLGFWFPLWIMGVAQSMPLAFEMLLDILFWFCILFSGHRRLQRGLGSLILRLGVAGVSGLKLNYSTLRANYAYLRGASDRSFRGLHQGCIIFLSDDCTQSPVLFFFFFFLNPGAEIRHSCCLAPFHTIQPWIAALFFSWHVSPL